MRLISARRFPLIRDEILLQLECFGEEVRSTHWQGQDISGKQEMTPIELQNVIFEMNMPETEGQAQHQIKPNLPWAEEHFLERVGGVPLNPPPSAKTWPFAQAGHVDHTDDYGQFSHTYPERFWPKHAGHDMSSYCDGSRDDDPGNFGVRYDLGDLNDVVDLLRTDLSTRQAYLPIWFPEDTGAVSDQRVPCSLGYHFMVRSGRLHVTYMIRAVDFWRHFADDVYMAVRLGQWVRDKLDREPLVMGNLTMHTMSMHCFAGDRAAMRARNAGMSLRTSERLLEELG